MYHARVGGFADSNKSDYYYNRNVSDATDLKPVCLRPNVPPGKNVGPVVSHSCHVRRRRFPHVLGYPAGPPSRSTRKRTRKRPTVVVVARRPSRRARRTEHEIPDDDRKYGEYNRRMGEGGRTLLIELTADTRFRMELGVINGRTEYVNADDSLNSINTTDVTVRHVRTAYCCP